ncbi:hypothetical protein B296_00002170 [Ensete ventricosum]|uniref:HMG box domain-containing protein n=1 Tax=Ensete ventricosum TaxID=4639 RepID=A0A427AER5_ENSVE|nr:hypothetical protein B296_00002170 [Ensete ventricosum]
MRFSLRPYVAYLEPSCIIFLSTLQDEDFVAEKDDGGSPTDDSGEEESDASENEDKKSSIKDSKKESTGVKAPSAKGKSKDGDEEGSKKRKPKRKKDPNAPKRAMSGFMFFSNAEREVSSVFHLQNLKKGNPGMSFTDVGRALGERWKKMTAEEKEPYESMAKADTKRYREAMADYKSGASSFETGDVLGVDAAEAIGVAMEEGDVDQEAKLHKEVLGDTGIVVKVRSTLATKLTEGSSNAAMQKTS